MATLYHARVGLAQLEQLATQDSPIHRLHPMSKLLTTFLYVGLVVSVPFGKLILLFPFFCYLAVIFPLSGTPLRPLLRTLLLALPFPLMAGIANLWFFRTPILSLGPLLLTDGVISLIALMLKAILCVLGVLLLMATTSFVNVCAGLARLRVPRLVCVQLLILYRYLSLFLNQASTMMTAYSLRNPTTKGIQLKDMGSFLGQLILRSFDRSDRVYQAMCCRGFTMERLSRYQKVTQFRSLDALYCIVVAVSLLLLRFVSLPLLW